jgi:hypothetical protein
MPDVVVDLSEADRKRLDHAWANAEEEVWGAPARFEDVPADWVDPQLEQALALIAGNLSLQDVRDGAAPGGG